MENEKGSHLVDEKFLRSNWLNAKKTENKKWHLVKDNVIASLQLVVRNNILSSISKLQLTKKIWDILTNLYDVKLLHNKIFLKRNSTIFGY